MKLAKTIPSFDRFIFEMECDMDNFDYFSKDRKLSKKEREQWRKNRDFSKKVLKISEQAYTYYLDWAKFNHYFIEEARDAQRRLARRSRAKVRSTAKR